MRKSSAPFYIDRKGIHISLDEVPAWLCPQCGESYFEEDEVDAIQALVKAIEEHILFSQANRKSKQLRM
jgi:YgiT-type zinc finger domain-containing protein